MENDQICTRCGHRGEARYDNPGSLAIEIVLWLCFIVPGVVYSIWRHAAAVAICESCGGREFIPANSPIGRKMVAEHSDAPASTPATSRRYRPTSGRKGGLAWKAGRFFGRLFGSR
jgi:hypothetical protein